MKHVISVRSVIFLLLAMVVATCAPHAYCGMDPYLKIAEGDSRARVIRLLGNPVDPDRDLTEAERKNIKKVIQITSSKDAVDVAVWKLGSHLYYLIGFNGKDLVATKHRLIGLVGGG